tara:strand:- start:86044 stop:86553 length:510 start_codon:yes stop_codon:yes gene_type:complete
MNGLLSVERMTLELIEAKPQTLIELKDITGLDLGVLNQVLENLLEIKIITLIKDKYILNKLQVKNLSKDVYGKENMKMEFLELFESHLNNSMKDKNKNLLRIKKVYFTQSELWHFEQKIKELEDYVKSIEQQRDLLPFKKEIVSQKVFFLGHGNYLDIVKEPLNRLKVC